MPGCQCANCVAWLARVAEPGSTTVGQAALLNHAYEDSRRRWREEHPILEVGDLDDSTQLDLRHPEAPLRVIDPELEAAERARQAALMPPAQVVTVFELPIDERPTR